MLPSSPSPSPPASPYLLLPSLQPRHIRTTPCLALPLPARLLTYHIITSPRPFLSLCATKYRRTHTQRKLYIHNHLDVVPTCICNCKGGLYIWRCPLSADSPPQVYLLILCWSCLLGGPKLAAIRNARPNTSTRIWQLLTGCKPTVTTSLAPEYLSRRN